jgi:hypothetical protein
VTGTMKKNIQTTTICIFLCSVGSYRFENILIYDLMRPKNHNNITDSNKSKGLSTRVRIAVRIAVPFRPRFLCEQNKDPILFLSPITMVRFHISAKNNQKLTCWTPLAANRTPNRMGIRMENRTCRQPLTTVLTSCATSPLPRPSPPPPRTSSATAR